MNKHFQKINKHLQNMNIIFHDFQNILIKYPTIYNQIYIEKLIIISNNTYLLSNIFLENNTKNFINNIQFQIDISKYHQGNNNLNDIDHYFN